MKRTLMKMLLLLSLLFISVGSTVAYLTDTEQEANVMTLGRVEIDLIEQERNSTGELVDFQDFHPLYPGYHPNGLNNFDDEGYWMNVRNAIDKVVTVKNTGMAPAYVRLWFAFEVTDEDNFLDEKLHLNRDDAQWEWYFLDDDEGNTVFLNLNGARYAIAIATYPEVLAPDATTPVSLRQVLLDSSATNDDYLKLGDKYSIFVVAQGMQTEGFDNAHHALNEGFGVPSATNHPFAAMTEEDAGANTGSDFTIYPAEKIDWYTGGIQDLLPQGSTFMVYDVETGIAWSARCGAGNNHAEIEPLTQADTERLCDIYDVDNPQEIVDKNLYQRRPCLVTVENRTFACSLYGVPHNPDADTIANNGMDGVLCLFFTNSTSHSDSVDASHEAAIEYAYQNAPNGQKQDGTGDETDVPESPASAFTWETNTDGDGIVITGYTGSDTQVHIPDRINSLPVTAIGGEAFADKEDLTQLILPETLTEIGYMAFAGCANLVNMHIPASVTYIDDFRTFNDCSKLTTITVAAGNPNYTSANGVLFSKNMKKLIHCPNGKSGVYTIPNGVTQINYEAFMDCANLTDIVIADTVDTINEMAFYKCSGLTSLTIPASVTGIDCRIVDGCSNLTRIEVSANNPNFASEDGVLFNKAKTILYAYPAGKSGPYTVPSSVESISVFAFNQSKALTSIILPPSITAIEADALWGCDNLVASVHEGSYAHQWCQENHDSFVIIGYAYPGYVVTQNSIHLRKQANSSSVSMGMIASGTVLPYYTLEDGWYKVDYNGTTGYVLSQYVQELIQTDYVKTTASNLNLRESPSSSGEVHTRVAEEGMILPCFSTESNDGYTWYYVFYDGYLGYIRSDFALLCEIDGTPQVNG